MKLTVLILIFISFASVFVMYNKSLMLNQKSIIYTGNFTLPNDPLDIETMEHYELSLALQSPWFETDEGGRAFYGVVNKWKFDDKVGAYIFEVNPNAKWSNGTNITAEDLKFNLLRVKISGSRFFKMIEARIDYSGLKVITSGTLLVPTKNGLPNDEIFQRLSSQALGIVHPSDVNEQGKVISAHITSGPYQIDYEKTNIKSIVLKKNDFYLFKSNEQPKNVVVKIGKQVSLNDFIAGNTEDSFITAYSLITKDEEEKIKGANFPTWTRGFDRVSSLRVNSSLSPKRKQEVHEVLKYFGSHWLTSERHTGLASSVSIAQSLQPLGYPLKYNVAPTDYGHIKKPKLTKLKAITYESKVTDLQIDQINKVATDIGLLIEWNIVTKSEWQSDNNVELNSVRPYFDKVFDLVLVSWGVADNDPGTWMSLILNPGGSFMDVSESDIKRSKEILQFKNRGEVIAGYIDLLRQKQLDGSYVPLYHFSTLTLGRENLSFDRIGDLDETVEFAKISIKE